MAWLIADFCDKHNISHTTLCDYISRANEDIHTEGLMWRKGVDQHSCFNLHKLSDAGLYRVYTEIPEHMRPVEKPAHEARPHKERKLSARDRQSRRKKARLAAKQETQLAKTTVHENFAWVQCDACDKWRRLFNTKEEDVPECWKCADHPDDDITCDAPEDGMAEDEQWDGTTKGMMLKISFNDGEATAVVMDESGDAIDSDLRGLDAEYDDDDEPSSVPSNEGKTSSSDTGAASKDPSDNEDGEDEEDDGGDVDVHNLFGPDDDDEGFEFHEGSVEGDSDE